jgi:hypothetical protein
VVHWLPWLMEALSIANVFEEKEKIPVEQENASLSQEIGIGSDVSSKISPSSEIVNHRYSWRIFSGFNSSEKTLQFLNNLFWPWQWSMWKYE